MFSNKSCNRVNRVSKTENGLYIYRFTYMLTEVIKSVYPISGIGVYFSQGENVKVHGVALKCGYLMKKYLKSTEW